MRPTTGTMLQQNNNNNYPCLSVSGSTREMLQKCSRASLPLPSRLELGLGDLPLIRGLRAWALCSKNRHKAGGLLGGGGSPAAPAAERGTSTSCPRPADIYLSGEWRRAGYGPPLGLDARQAGIGALVTVATLKSSLGGGKTQTQCLFLRTEKGSCLYSTAKPGSGAATGTASRTVGEWLRGKKSGEGVRDSPAGRRDGGPTPSGVNRVRVRSGRRWRKSCSTAHREKEQSSRENPAAELAVEERQEEEDKAGLERKRFPSMQQDARRDECCHDDPPESCSRCGIRLQEEYGGGERLEGGVLNRLDGEMKGMKRKGQKSKEEEESNPEQESNWTNKNSPAGPDVHEDGGMSGTEGEEVLRSPSPQNREDFTAQQEPTKTRPDDKDLTCDCGSTVRSNVKEDNGCDEDQKSEGEEEEKEEERAFAAARSKESSVPAEGSVPGDDTSGVQAGQGCKRDPAEVLVQEADVGFKSKEAEEERRQPEERRDVSSRLGRIDTSTGRDGKLPRWEDGALRGTESTSRRRDDAESEVSEVEDNGEEVKKSRSSEEEWRLQEDGEQRLITCIQSNAELSAGVHGDACAGPPTPGALPLTNPAPSLPPLESMATGLPCLEVEKEEKGEEEVVRLVAADGGEGQRVERRNRSEQGEEEWDSNVATEEGSAQEEEEEDEFGVFVQAEGEAAWSEEVKMSASVPCGRSDRTALGSCGITEEWTGSTLSWEDRSFHQSDDSWTAFSQDASHEGEDTVGQWWPASAMDTGRDRLLNHHNLAAAFAEAFPSPPGPSTGDSCTLDAVPTLTQLLRGEASQDQGLLDSFHDLNKLIGRRYKRADGVSHDLLLKTLHLQPPPVDNRPASWTANRHLSPGLPSASRHAQTAAAKRRLSYDYNRNVTL